VIPPASSTWQIKATPRNQVCTFTGTDEYAGTVFLPTADEPAFRQWQKTDQSSTTTPSKP
ncbi:MAG TPA: hypothetical protein PKO06_15850, partial [Candidatus Ozemobacteraceae bacterium]|nr:hypothetical protein [Candidatus Ozemobacteraceae bacterium]